MQAFIICALAVWSLLSLVSINVSALSPYDSGYSHGYDDAQLFNPSDHYLNQPGKGSELHTDEFMDGYNAGYAAYEASIAGNGNVDCFERGITDGEDYPFNQETYNNCGDDYYTGYIEGCMSVEGNTRDVCESATDA